jgi:hypothetical protein
VWLAVFSWNYFENYCLKNVCARLCIQSIISVFVVVVVFCFVCFFGVSFVDFFVSGSTQHESPLNQIQGFRCVVSFFLPLALLTHSCYPQDDLSWDVVW